MTPERAIEILTPGATKFTPQEYEDACLLAVVALQCLKESRT